MDADKDNDKSEGDQDETLKVMANDVLIAPTLTHFILTHPGNLVFSVSCQWYASTLPPNDELVNVNPTACLIFKEIQMRGGRFLKLKKDSNIPEELLSRNTAIDRIVSILVTIRSIQSVEEAIQLSVPEILFSLNKPMPVVESPSHPNKFPLSFWFKKEYDEEKKEDRISVVPPELPKQDETVKDPVQSASPSAPSASATAEHTKASSRAKRVKVTKELIEDAMPPAASSIFHVFDRRINFDNHPADASIYSLMRSWVQDDPHRIISNVGMEMLSGDEYILVAAPDDDDDALVRRLEPAMKRLDVFGMLAESTAADPPSVDDIRQDLIDQGKRRRTQHTARMKRCQAEAKRSLQNRGIKL